MKKLTCLAFLFLLVNGLFAQNIIGINNNKRLVTAPNFKHSAKPKRLRGQSQQIYVDYDIADAQNYNSDEYLSYMWATNMHYSLAAQDPIDSAGMNYFIVAFDTLVDANTLIGYPQNQVSSISIDTLNILVGHTNHSGTLDTIRVSVINLTNSNILWTKDIVTDTGLSVSPTGFHSWDYYYDLAIPVHFSLPSGSNGYGVEVQYYGNKRDTFGFIAGFGDPGLENCVGSNYKAAKSAYYPNSYSYWVSQGALLPGGSGDIFYDCNADGQYEANIDGNSFIQNIKMQSVVTINNDELYVSDSTSSATCGNSNGSAFVFVNGGTTPYSYTWSNGSTTQNLINVGAGIYNVTVTDNASDIGYATLTITNSNGPVITATPVGVSQVGGNDGSISLSVNGGTPPYKYAWSTSASDTLQTLKGLTEGNYSVTVTDAAGCFATISSTVINSGQVSVTFQVDVSKLIASGTPICSAGMRIAGIFGTLGASTGGVPMLDWAPTDTTGKMTGLGNNIWSTIITFPDTAGANSDTLFFKFVDGNWYSGGNGPGTNEDANSDDSLVQGGCARPNVDVFGGCRIFIIPAAGGKTYRWCYDHCTTCDGGDPLYLDIHETHIDPTCGNSDGSISITDTTGTTPFTYAWSNGATTQNLSNVAAGRYSLTVTDRTGLANSITIALGNATGPVISATIANASSIGGSDGSITLAVTGGVSPYTYIWNNGTTNSLLANIKAGQYTVTVTDVNGCLGMQSYTVSQGNFSNFYVYLSDNQPNCTNNGSESTYIYGGTPPYNFLWSTGDITQTVTGLGTGNYSVTVTDADGRNGIGTDYLYSSCYNVIEGRVFNDANNNCIFDAGDSPFSWATVTADDGAGNYYYGFTNYDGTYSIDIPTRGAFTITVYPNYYGTACGNITLCGNGNNKVSFGSVGDTSTINVGFVGSTGYDLTIHPGWTSAKPGFQKEYWVMPYNQAATNNFAGSATVVFKYDSALVYQNSYDPQPVHNAAAHTLTWVVDSIPWPIFDWYNVRFENFFTVPASLPLGYQLQSDFYITPTSGDCDTSNNHLSFSEDVSGSHDPNEKEVSPAGNISPDDSVLTYTIHFQNDGTDTTSFIIVRDTLSPNLNPASAQTIASSHPYQQFYVSGKGILTWVFNPIYLVDSASNVAASKGFVSFRIKKKANLPLNTVISNKASIFFDYNSGVVTNTVTNIITDINTGLKPIAGSNVSVNVYPNPFNETSTFEVTGIKSNYSFTLSNVLGQQVQQLNNLTANKFDINRNSLNAGIYFYSIVVNGKAVANGKVVVE